MIVAHVTARVIENIPKDIGNHVLKPVTQPVLIPTRPRLQKNKRPVGLSSFVNCPPVVASFLTQRQLSVMPDDSTWAEFHIPITSTSNAALPLFATRFASCTGSIWVTFIAISHLKWHVFAIWSPQTFHMVIYCGLNIELHYFHVYCMSMLTTNSSDNMQKHGYLGCFHAASATENRPKSGVCGIRGHGTHTFRLQPSSICDSIANALELRLCWTSLSIYNIPLRINHYL